jgi:outer membrane protein assembly factor BamA
MDLPSGNLTSPVLKRALDRIVNLYVVDGYELTDIADVAIDSSARTLTITVDEAIVQRIDVENNVKARDWLVRSYCPLKVGQPYSTRAASHGVSNIYGTDLFEQVSIEPMPVNDGVAAVITVREKKSTQVRLGWHWDDEYQSEEFAELLDDNVMGVGVEYALHAQYGNDHQLYSGELKANRIFSTYLTARLEVYHDRLSRNLYDGTEHPIGERDEITNGSCFTVGQQIVRLGTVSAKLKVRDITSSDPRSDYEETLRLRQVIFESHVESFDRWPFPHSGKRNYIELAFAGKYLGGNTEFTRFFGSLESYFPFGQVLCYHPTFSVGLSRSNLPLTEKFYIGGQRSFSGLRTMQAAGDKLLMLNQELRVKLPLRLYVITRLDVGEVYATAEQIKLRNLRTGFGLSLAFDSPIGPVEFGYGITNHRADRFYFSAGPSF